MLYACESCKSICRYAPKAQYAADEREREREAAKLEKGGEMNCISTVPGTIEYFYSGYFTDGL